MILEKVDIVWILDHLHIIRAHAEGKTIYYWDGTKNVIHEEERLYSGRAYGIMPIIEIGKDYKTKLGAITKIIVKREVVITGEKLEVFEASNGNLYDSSGCCVVNFSNTDLDINLLDQ